MPQFHAVQCFQCEAFQVQQVKKTGKFACSVCGARQSVRQAFCCSDRAKDVRLVVMELNLKRGVKRKAEDELLGQVQEPTAAASSQEAVAGTRAPEWDTFVEDDTQLLAALEEAEQMENAAFVTALPEGLEHGGKRPKQRSATDCAAAGQHHQRAPEQQQLGRQSTGAATAGTQGSERRAAAATQLQARSARKVMTADKGRSAAGLLPGRPNLPLQRPLRVQGSLPAQQSSAHHRHPRRHSPVQQGPGWGQRAPVLQAPNLKEPEWPNPQPAGSADGGWGSFMTQQETRCAAFDDEEDHDGLTFAVD